jgi:hypothetical protein
MRFRQGAVEKIDEGTDDYYAHLIALAIQIVPGELGLNPQYGVEDPTFSDVLTRDLAFTAGAYIPEIIIETANIAVAENGQARVDINFRQRT